MSQGYISVPQNPPPQGYTQPPPQQGYQPPPQQGYPPQGPQGGYYPPPSSPGGYSQPVYNQGYANQPVPSPGAVPPPRFGGIQYVYVADPMAELAMSTGVLIRQEAQFFEQMAGCESPNRYYVFSQSPQIIV